MTERENERVRDAARVFAIGIAAFALGERHAERAIEDHKLILNAVRIADRITDLIAARFASLPKDQLGDRGQMSARIQNALIIAEALYGQGLEDEKSVAEEATSIVLAIMEKARECCEE